MFYEGRAINKLTVIGIIAENQGDIWNYSQKAKIFIM